MNGLERVQPWEFTAVSVLEQQLEYRLDHNNSNEQEATNLSSSADNAPSAGTPATSEQQQEQQKTIIPRHDGGENGSNGRILSEKIIATVENGSVSDESPKITKPNEQENPQESSSATAAQPQQEKTTPADGNTPAASAATAGAIDAVASTTEAPLATSPV